MSAQSKILAPGYKPQIVLTMKDGTKHRVDSKELREANISPVAYFLAAGLIQGDSQVESLAVQPVAMNNEELLAAIRAEVGNPNADVEVVKALVAKLTPRSMPDDVFDAVARLYMRHEPVSKPKASEPPYGPLYEASQYPAVGSDYNPADGQLNR